MKRTLKGTITRHRGFWCLRYRERTREGDTIKTVQRSRRLAPVDALHKTRRSVEGLAETALEPINKVPAPYVAIRLGDFAEGAYFPHLETKRRPSTLRGYRQDVEPLPKTALCEPGDARRGDSNGTSPTRHDQRRG